MIPRYSRFLKTKKHFLVFLLLLLNVRWNRSCSKLVPIQCKMIKILFKMVHILCKRIQILFKIIRIP